MTREEFLKNFPDLVTDYKAAPEVVKQIGNLDLLMIVGGTGVGKTSIIKRLGIPYVLSDTTRPIRPWEINGLDYFFRTDYEDLMAEIKESKFVQVNIFSTGDFYGTRASAFPELGYAVIAVVADRVPEFRQLGFNDTICAFITPPSYEEWMSRINKSGFDRNQMSKRFEEAARSFNFALNDHNTHFILNDDLDEAVEQTKKLLAGKPNASREDKARQAAQEIHHKLGQA